MESPVLGVGNENVAAENVAAEIVAALTSKSNQANPLFGRAISNMHSKPPENRDIKLEALSLGEFEKSMAQQRYSSEWFSRFKRAEAVLNENSETQSETESKDEAIPAASGGSFFETDSDNPAKSNSLRRTVSDSGPPNQKRLRRLKTFELMQVYADPKIDAAPVEAELKEPTVTISPPVMQKQNPAKRKFVCPAIFLIALSVAGLAAYIQIQDP